MSLKYERLTMNKTIFIKEFLLLLNNLDEKENQKTK